MKRIPSASWTLTPLLFGCLALIGCNGAGPDFVSRPDYTPAQDLPRFTAETAVAVRVTDARQKKLGSRDDGREVIAEGDKGKVFLSESPSKTLERNLTDALTKAGFKVEANAPVVVDANLRQLEVTAYEFTHWGLPTEQNIVGPLAFVPGPVRPTLVKTVLDVVIRKNEQRLGFAYYVEKNAENKDRDRAIVDKTIGQSMTAAIDEVIRKAAPDINIAAKLPVSDAEIAAYSNKYNEQLAQLNTMKQLIAAERTELAADRADLASVKQELERDRQNWNAEKAQILAKNTDAGKQAAALAQEQARLKQAQNDLAAKQAEIKRLTDAAGTGTAEQEAKLKQVRTELAAAQAELKKVTDASTTLTATQEARLKQLQGELAAKDAEVKRLADTAGRTAEQEAQLKKLQGELATSQAEVKRLSDSSTRTADQEAAIKRLQSDLAAKEVEVQRLATAAGRTPEQEARIKSLQDDATRQAEELKKSQQATTAAQERVDDLNAQVARQQVDLDRRQRDYDKSQQNLEALKKEIEAKENANKNLESGIGKQQSDLTRKEDSLREWEKQLKAKSQEKPPIGLVQNLRPSVAVVEPQPNITETSAPRAVVKGILMDDRAIVKKRFTVNGKEVPGKLDVQFTGGAKGFRIERVAAMPITAKSGATGAAGDGAAQVFEKFEFNAELQKGGNTITIEAWDEEGLGAKEELMVNYKPGEGKVYIVAVGINKYQTVPQLKYAAADAKVLAKVLQERLSVPAENVELLLDEQATLQNLKRTLGVNLKARASKQDMAIIFFSGHGAPEEDAAAEGDGIEKYLLPVDADMNSFYSTALPMKDVTEIFRRLPCQRVVFIADTCYSGAVGNADGKGKTVSKPGKTFRAFSIERVVDRLSGTGRIIMTASKGSEISQEKDDLGHGVFTYYVAQGLSGQADKNRDRLVTATELYNYVSVEVAKATGNNQNPLMSKDEAVGEIVLSIVK